MIKIIRAFMVASAAFFIASAQAETVNNHAFAIGKGPGVQGFTSILCGAGQLAIGQTSADPACFAPSGDLTMGAGGSFAIAPNKVQNTQFRQSGALSLIGRSANSTGNIADIQATAGSSCVFMESASTLTCAAIATANIANSAVTNAKLANMGAASLKCNPTAAGAAPTDCTIQGLTARGAPDATNDKLLIYDNAAATLKYVTPGQVAAAATAGVSSLNGLTGALNVAAGTGMSVSAAGSNVTVSQSLTNAVLQANPTNPASASSSAGGLMMGIGSTCKLTTVYSGRMRVFVQGGVAQSGSGSSGTGIQLRYGNGAAPANGAASTGISISSNPVFTTTAGQTAPFSVSGIATGLTVGTAYWIDIVVSNNAAQNSIANNMSCTLEEF
jgi:hypothetical protein